MVESPERTANTLVMRSALARRDYWVEERRVAAEKGDQERSHLCDRFVNEYDELLAQIAAECGGAKGGGAEV